MEIALRVLTDIAQKRDPDRQDVDQLLQFAPELAGKPIDDVARTVILAFLKGSGQC